MNGTGGPRSHIYRSMPQTPCTIVLIDLVGSFFIFLHRHKVVCSVMVGRPDCLFSSCSRLVVHVSGLQFSPHLLDKAGVHAKDLEKVRIIRSGEYSEQYPSPFPQLWRIEVTGRSHYLQTNTHM